MTATTLTAGAAWPLAILHPRPGAIRRAATLAAAAAAGWATGIALYATIREIVL